MVSLSKEPFFFLFLEKTLFFPRISEERKLKCKTNINYVRFLNFILKLSLINLKNNFFFIKKTLSYDISLNKTFHINKKYISYYYS